MEKDQIQKLYEEGKIAPAILPALPGNPKPTEKEDAEYGLSQYLIFLNAMKFKKTSLSTAPTFIPKNFYDQIQFYDSGGTRRIYIYVNDSAGWRYVALT